LSKASWEFPKSPMRSWPSSHGNFNRTQKSCSKSNFLNWCCRLHKIYLSSINKSCVAMASPALA
jgi:hypothetical protein